MIAAGLQNTFEANKPRSVTYFNQPNGAQPIQIVKNTLKKKLNKPIGEKPKNIPMN